MSNGRNKNGGRPSDPRGAHARLYWEILDSNAYRCLSATDQRAYMALQRQLRSTNNGDLSLPLSVARHSGITSPATLAKSLRALVAVGLLTVTRKGGCNRGGQRLPTLYRFTDHEAYPNPMKNIEGFKATNEWKSVKTLPMGAALIRKAEDDAKKTQLQKLAVTASKIKVVGRLTASINEEWTPSPASNTEAREKPISSRKANAGKDLKKSSNFSNSENHTSDSEVLSIVAIPKDELGLRAVRITAVRPALAGPAAIGFLTTFPPDTPAASLAETRPGAADWHGTYRRLTAKPVGLVTSLLH